MKNVWYAHGENAVGWQGLRDWLAALEPFSNRDKTFHGGEWVPSGGRLYQDANWLAEYKGRGYDGKIDYVVYSYETPIAWHDKERGWRDPGLSYSKTTAGKHYGPTITAISQLGEQ